MASSDNASAISLIAGEAITIFRFIEVVDGVTVATMCDNPADRVLGVSGESVGSGDVLPVVMTQGAIVMIELGATLGAGDAVSSGTNGVAAAATTTVNEFTAGQLLEGGGSGDIVRMILNPMVDPGS